MLLHRQRFRSAELSEPWKHCPVSKVGVTDTASRVNSGRGTWLLTDGQDFELGPNAKLRYLLVLFRRMI